MKDKIINWDNLSDKVDQTFNKNLLFLHDLVVCPGCGTKVRIKMEAID